MKMYGEVNVQLHLFIILALYGGEWLDLPPSRFSPGPHSIEALLGPKSVLTVWRIEKSFSFIVNRTPIRRASSQ
jgi:hypothetical protein